METRLLVELPVDLFEVTVDGVQGDEQTAGDALGRQALRRQARHRQLDLHWDPGSEGKTANAELHDAVGPSRLGVPLAH
ncbi:hypothetical protein GCM10010214_20560 [Streptomyces abikoensis]|nr:hypothetical protein GCM10010214_20560 [Streptomyces abikoensis]